ncbi:MAG: TonB-dependent receptor [Melioribacteraceae bacterium]|nr:TonB-dependent receptor [Melioribacteraceae bacterium]
MKRLIILMFFTISISAQVKSLEGKVLNFENLEPIPFCNILIEGKNISAISNQNGYFLISDEISLSDKIIFNHIGFVKKIILVKDFLNQSKKEVLLESKLFSSQTILVKGIISDKKNTPISFSKIKREEFVKSYSTQDIPELISYLPSTYFYSENGNGLGYNYLSIRGFDQRRISVSINGIPQNDPEDHNVYWIDFPDLIENSELIQVQRGAGNGIIGYPSIGGSVNIITSTFSDKSFLELNTAIGSYNTRKYGVSFSSGLINNKYSFSGKISQTLSSGYRNLSWVDLKSYHISAVRFDDNLTTQINIYGGPIADGLAYTGLPKFAIKDKNLRKQNYSYWEADKNSFTYVLERRAEEIENFSQPHFEILNQYKFDDNLNFNSALFLVLGNGFFDYDASWADTSYFRLTKEFGFTPKENPTNSLIRAMVENKQFGWIPKLNLKHSNGELIVGGEFRFHNSLHWGSINYANNLPENLSKSFKYYQYNGSKDIINLFFNENYNVSEKINLLSEIQFAYNKYKLFNEKFLNNNFSIKHFFINPRIGVNYKYDDKLSGYLSFAFIQREPRLKNYYDAAESSGGELPQFELNNDGSYNFNSPLVKPEKMYDIELGANYNNEKISFSLNGYYMMFKDEIVKKGQLDRFGQPITGNMDNTIHYGIEATFNYKIQPNLELILNSSLSKNIISNGNTFVKTKDLTGKKVIAKIDLENNSISGFPDSYFNSIIKYSNDNFYLQLSTKYVGSFYTDNYAEKLPSLLRIYPKLTDYIDNKVDSYFLINLFVSNEFDVEYIQSKIKLYLQVNNLTNNLYAAYGIGGEFFPAAERNYLFGVKINL